MIKREIYFFSRVKYEEMRDKIEQSKTLKFGIEDDIISSFSGEKNNISSQSKTDERFTVSFCDENDKVNSQIDLILHKT